MRRRHRASVFAITAIASFASARPALAVTPPPPAWTCTAEVTGVNTGHQNLSPLAVTAAVQTVTAVVVCEPLGFLTTPPIEYLPLYQGGLSLHVHRNSENRKCGDSVVAIPSVGPTLVMTASAVCLWEPVTYPVTFRPWVYWSTSDLTGGQLTIAGKAGAFVVL